MLSFLYVLLVGLGIGVGYIALYFLQLFTKTRIVRFIYDLLYAIISGGIFIVVMVYINMFDVEYYHILALMIGVLLGGVLPVRSLRKREENLISKVDSTREKIHSSTLYKVIKK